MGKKKKSSAGPPVVFTIALLILAAIVGAGIWMNRKPPKQTAPPVQSERPHSVAAVTDNQRMQVKIYVLQITDGDIKLVPESHSVLPGANKHKAAIDKLLATNRKPGPSENLIPAGTKLRSLKIRNKVAYADFSKEIIDNFPGGSMSESLLVNSIVFTLTQFEDVDKVQFLIDGKKVESIGGHLDASQPISGDKTLLGKGESE
ncbi:MAG TPA: GerMN domain-containing protein [Armatimonadota bacterium]|nr:GerMN domain-containing protein [Armatimonadota bacterium]